MPREGHRVDAGGNPLQAFFENGLGQNRGSRRAVAGDVVRLAGGFLDQLGAEILERIVEFDVFGNRDAVFGHFGRAPTFVEHCIATARAQRAADSLGQFRNPRQQRLPGFIIVYDLLCHSRNPPVGSPDRIFI